MNRLSLRIAALALLALVLTSASAFASHSRYATIQWRPNVVTQNGQPVVQPNVIVFTFNSTWRRSYPWNANGSAVNVGSVVTIGNFCFGDNTACVPVNATVTSQSLTEDWIDTTYTVTHTYPTSGTFLAGIQNCCRLSTISDANHDVNFYFETQVTIAATPNSSPSSGTLPVINVPQGIANAKFSIVASDPDNDPLAFSLAPLARSGLAVAAPAGLTINPQTGVVTWDTRSAVLNGLYAVQFLVADNKGANIPVDVLLHPIAATSTPPSMQINGSTSPQTFTVPVGSPVTFTLNGVDPNIDPGTGLPNRFVTLSAAGVPLGAVLNPSLPVTLRSPAASTFTWTPATTDVGNHTVTFGATSDTGQQASNSATIVVPQFNRPPAATCTIPTLGVYGSLSPLNVTVSDPDADPLTVRWSIDGTTVQTDSVPGSTAGTPDTYLANWASAGSHTVTVTVSDAALSTTCSGTVDVAKADQTVMFASVPDHYVGDAPFALTAFSSSGGPVDFVVVSGPATVSGNYLTVTGNGNVQVRAVQAGDGNYNPAQADQAFTVFPVLNVTSITLETRQWNGHVPTDGTDAANTYFSLPLGVPGYAPGPKTLTIFDNVSNQITFGGVNSNLGYHHHFAFTAPVDGTLSIRMGADFGRGGALLIDGNVVDFRNTDMYWNLNYNDPTQYLKGTVQITAGPHVVDSYGFEDCCDGPQQAQYSYLGSPYRTFTAPANTVPVVTLTGPTSISAGTTQTYTFTVVDPDAGATFTVANVSCGTNGTPAGPATTTATGGTFDCTFPAGDTTSLLSAAVADNFGAVSNIASLNVSIAKVAQTISFGPLSNATYGDPDITVAATASSGLPVSLVAGGACTISGTTVHIVSAGACSLTASQAGDGKYAAAADVTQSFTIEKAMAAITIAPFTGVYDGQPHKLTGSAHGLAGEDFSALLDLGNAFTAAPGGTAHWTFAGNGNYAVASGDAAVTIAQKTAVVTVDPATKVYGSADPVFTGTLTGFLPADGVTAAYSRNAGETAGSYTISATLSPGAALANYDITYNTAAFDITKKAASVTPNAATKVYGSADPAFTGTLAGFLPADGVTAAYSRNAGETVGSFTISATLSPGAVLANYDVTYNTAALAITAAPLTVKADDKTRDFLAPNPAFTASFAGFVNGETPAALGGTLTFATPAVAGSPLGAYPIVPGGLVSTNYAITFVPGTLTVVDITPPVIAPLSNVTTPALRAEGTPVTFTAAAVDAVDGNVTPVCTPVSGTTFPIGSTVVTCVATDAHGNSSSATFTVTITNDPTPGLISGTAHVDLGTVRTSFNLSMVELPIIGKDLGSFWLTNCVVKPGAHGDNDSDKDDHDGCGSPDDRPRTANRNTFVASSFSFVRFSNDPASSPGRAPWEPLVPDTVVIAGTGRWNGVDGYTFELVAADRGEPGRGRDTFEIVIKAPNGTQVASVPVNTTISSGNIQAGLPVGNEHGRD